MTKIFVNLAVADLGKSIAFFEALGFALNPQFTDETAACMVVSDVIYAMLLTHTKFREFTNKELVDATKATEVLTCLTMESREKVDALVDRALKAGARETRDPMDHGFMYGRSFDDLDGHIWEIIWMNEGHIDPNLTSRDERGTSP